MGKLSDEVPDAVTKYAPSGFDSARFNVDFRNWIANYPDYPDPEADLTRPNPQVEALYKPEGEFLEVALREFGPLAHDLGMEYDCETLGDKSISVFFMSDVKRLTIENKFAIGRIEAFPCVIADRSFIRRTLSLKLDCQAEDGTVPIEIFQFIKHERKYTELGRVVISDPRDFHEAMRAFATFFRQHPEHLFPLKGVRIIKAPGA